MIDFGLATISPLPEDRAVDLYVLERAFASTHPIPLLPSGEDGIPHFTTVLEGYRKVMETKGRRGEWTRVQRRLDAVRGRGRKRSMVG
jgi:TP53 regulating kinase-like protein